MDWWFVIGVIVYLLVGVYIAYGLAYASTLHGIIKQAQYIRDECKTKETLERETARYQVYRERDRFKDKSETDKNNTNIGLCVVAWVAVASVSIYQVIKVRNKGIELSLDKTTIAWKILIVAVLPYIALLIVLPIAAKRINDIQSMKLSVEPTYNKLITTPINEDDTSDTSKKKYTEDWKHVLSGDKKVTDFKEAILRRYRAVHPGTQLSDISIIREFLKTDTTSLENNIGYLHPESDYRLAQRISDTESKKFFYNLIALRKRDAFDDTDALSDKVGTVLNLMIFAAFVLGLNVLLLILRKLS